MDQPALWTVKDVARFLACSESWVRHAAAAGRIPCRKISGLLRFVPAEIQAMTQGEGIRGRVVVRGLLPRNTTVA